MLAAGTSISMVTIDGWTVEPRTDYMVMEKPGMAPHVYTNIGGDLRFRGTVVSGGNVLLPTPMPNELYNPASYRGWIIADDVMLLTRFGKCAFARSIEGTATFMVEGELPMLPAFVMSSEAPAKRQQHMTEMPWTEEEKGRLVDMHNKMGNAWTDISKLFPGRTHNAVRHRCQLLGLKEEERTPWTPEEDAAIRAGESRTLMDKGRSRMALENRAKALTKIVL